MIPRRYSHILFSFFLSCLMSAIVSGIATYRTIGIPAEFASIWFGSWLTSWMFAFPAVLVVAPIARRLVSVLTAPPEATHPSKD